MVTPKSDGVVASAPIRRPKNFGKRRELPTITIEGNGKRRQYRFSIVGAMTLFGIVAMLGIGYFTATAYLFFRDDLITLSHNRNSRLVSDYENRIARLRAGMDRLTSRHLLDQKTIEDRVELLVRRQAIIDSRSKELDELLRRARNSGLTDDSRQPESNSGDNSASLFSPWIRGSSDSLYRSASRVPVSPADPTASLSEGPDIGNLLVQMDESISEIERRHLTAADLLASRVNAWIDSGHAVLAGLGMSERKADPATGGPFVPTEDEAGLEDKLEYIHTALKQVDTLQRTLDQLPLSNPVPGHTVSSAFGKRIDPFLKKVAMHSGIDFAADAGAQVHAAGRGTIIEAGWNGGYGKTVVVDHGNGLTSRYAHLRNILVTPGDTVEKGSVVGRLGSTGRSTGPHLHYEIRHNDNLLDPARYLKAGRHLTRSRGNDTYRS